MKSPMLISGVMFACGLTSIVLPIAFTVDFLDGGTFSTINGKTIITDNLTLVDGINTVLYWLLCCIITWGFWKRVSWTRYVIVLVYALGSLYTLIFKPISIELFIAPLGVLLSYWYLFKKANVVEYFESEHSQNLKTDASDRAS